MKKFQNKILILLIVIFSVVMMASCESNEEEKTDNNSTLTEPTLKEDAPYVYEGTPTIAPYAIYNADDTLYKGGFDNMFDAIREAGANSSSSNVLCVKDGNDLTIFKYQANSKCWCFDGTNYVGTMSLNEALKWGKGREKCYVINGKGSSYEMVGAKYYENSDMTQNIPLELNTGAYNYMFSKSGKMVNGQWEKLGYGYLECNVRLSEATYTPTTATDGEWNVYIFLNAGAGVTSDLGLIGVVRDGKVVFALVRNCGHSSHINDDGFKVFSWDPVTTMEYDVTKGVYCGADDLRFQCWQTIDGFKMDITNLSTNKVYTIEEKHTGMFEDCAQYMRFLLAASYVPVVGKVWNARNQASLRNVIFDNVYVARFNPTNDYKPEDLEEFYPGSPTMNYGFSQGADCASMIYDTYKEDGTYLSGATYSVGEKFISYSVYYDGGEHYSKNEE